MTGNKVIDQQPNYTSSHHLYGQSVVGTPSFKHRLKLPVAELNDKAASDLVELAFKTEDASLNPQYIKFAKVFSYGLYLNRIITKVAALTAIRWSELGRKIADADYNFFHDSYRLIQNLNNTVVTLLTNFEIGRQACSAEYTNDYDPKYVKMLYRVNALPSIFVMEKVKKSFIFVASLGKSVLIGKIPLEIQMWEHALKYLITHLKFSHEFKKRCLILYARNNGITSLEIPQLRNLFNKRKDMILANAKTNLATYKVMTETSLQVERVVANNIHEHLMMKAKKSLALDPYLSVSSNLVDDLIKKKQSPDDVKQEIFAKANVDSKNKVANTGMILKKSKSKISVYEGYNEFNQSYDKIMEQSKLQKEGKYDDLNLEESKDSLENSYSFENFDQSDSNKSENYSEIFDSESVDSKTCKNVLSDAQFAIEETEKILKQEIELNQDKLRSDEKNGEWNTRELIENFADDFESPLLDQKSYDSGTHIDETVASTAKKLSGASNEHINKEKCLNQNDLDLKTNYITKTKKLVDISKSENVEKQNYTIYNDESHIICNNSPGKMQNSSKKIPFRALDKQSLKSSDIKEQNNSVNRNKESKNIQSSTQIAEKKNLTENTNKKKESYDSNLKSSETIPKKSKKETLTKLMARKLLGAKDGVFFDKEKHSSEINLINANKSVSNPKKSEKASNYVNSEDNQSKVADEGTKNKYSKISETLPIDQFSNIPHKSNLKSSSSLSGRSVIVKSAKKIFQDSLNNDEAPKKMISFDDDKTSKAYKSQQNYEDDEEKIIEPLFNKVRVVPQDPKQKIKNKAENLEKMLSIPNSQRKD